MRVWTVNEEEDIRFLIEQNVDAIITNEPKKAIQIRGEKNVDLP